MICIGLVSYWMNNNTGALKLGPVTILGGRVDSGSQSFLGAGQGVGGITLFFTMAASLYSGYTISGIANEAYTFGFMAVRWIPAGVSLYAAFMVLAPRLHALGKARGYLTLCEFIYDRYSAPACSPAVPHILRIVALFCLQLPVFCYLISQFSSIAVEIAQYTGGGLWSGPGMSRYGTMITAGVVMLVCGLLGGLRAVAYNDVFQGMILMVGCVVFFIIEEQELGGLGGVKDYVTSPEYKAISKFGFGNFNNIPKEAGGWSTAAYASFILKVMVAASMFPHLAMRLFVAKDNKALKMGLAGMNFTFFIVQLSTLITGWVAVSAFGGAGKISEMSAFSCCMWSIEYIQFILTHVRMAAQCRITHTHIHTHDPQTHTHTCVCMYIHISIHENICLYTFMSRVVVRVCACVDTYIYIYRYMSIYVYMLRLHTRIYQESSRSDILKCQRSVQCDK